MFEERFVRDSIPYKVIGGVNFYEALGGAAFVTRVRAILLRDTGDYIWATLTDPTPQPDAMAMLRTAYPNAMRLDYRPQGAEILPADTAQSVRGKPFASLFEDFFTQMNGRPLTVEEARAVKALREEASK